MRKIIILLAIFLFLSLNAVNFNWSEAFGDEESDVLWDMDTNSEGEIAAVGYFTKNLAFGDIVLESTMEDGGSYSYDLYVAKFDATGTPLWAFSAGDTELDKATSVEFDSEGNIYVSGLFAGTITFADSTISSFGNNKSIYTAKLNGEGELLWLQHHGDPSETNGNAYNNGLALDNQGNVYTVGRLWKRIEVGDIVLESEYYGDAFVIKYDSEGNILWAKNTNTSYDGRGYGIDTDSNGNVYISGDYKGTLTFAEETFDNTDENDEEDIFLAKYDSEGNELWAQTVNGFGENISWCLKVGPYDNCYLTGDYYYEAILPDTTYNCPSPGYDIFIAKFNPQGEIQWSQNGQGHNYQRIHSIDIKDPFVYISGYTGDTITMGDFTISPQSTDCLLAKIGLDGTVYDLSTLVGAGISKGTAIKALGDSVCVGGTFYENITLGEDQFYAEGFNDIFISNMNIEGNFGTVTGTVYDSSNDTPIQNAIVHIAGAIAYTDSLGNYSMPKLAGTFEMNSIKPFYDSCTIDNIEINAGETTNCDITLTPYQTALKPPKNVHVNWNDFDAVNVNWETDLPEPGNEMGYDNWISDELAFLPVGPFDVSYLAVSYAAPQETSIDKIRAYMFSPVLQEQTVNVYVFGDNNYLPDPNNIIAGPIAVTLDKHLQPGWVEIDTNISVEQHQNFYIVVEWNEDNHFFVGGDYTDPNLFCYTTINSGDNWMTWDLHDFLIHPVLGTNTKSPEKIKFIPDSTNPELPLVELDNTKQNTSNQLFKKNQANSSKDGEPTAYCLYHNGQEFHIENHQTGNYEYSYTKANLEFGEHEFSVSAFYGDQESASTFPVEISLEEPIMNKPMNLSYNIQENDVNLSWDMNPGIGNWFAYHNGIIDDAIGTGEADNFDVAMRLTPAELEGFDGMYLTKINFVPSETLCDYTIKIWKDGSAYEPGDLILEQPVTDFIEMQWNDIKLQTPILVEADKELWIGYNANSQSGFPAGIDSGPAVYGKGSWIKEDSGWRTLSSLSLDYNLAIEGLFIDTTTQEVCNETPIPEKDNFINIDKMKTAGYQFDITKDRVLQNVIVYRDAEEIATLPATTTEYSDSDLSAGIYDYFVRAQYEYGLSEPCETVTADLSNVNNGNNDIPLVTQLNNIYPNPFNPITNISYSLAEDQKVNITVYNARGAKVKTLENSLKTVGKHSVVWKGNDSSGNIVASGIYFLKFQTNTKQTTKKLLLIK